MEHGVDAFLAKYAPDIAADVRAARTHLAAYFPRGFELVYDNYNALVFAYAANDKASGAVVSIAAYPKWVTLFFLHGSTLPDPHALLQGTGSTVRSVRLQPMSLLQSEPVATLLEAAIAPHAAAFAAAPALSTVVKSVSARQRPRRAAAAANPAPKRPPPAKRTARGT